MTPISLVHLTRVALIVTVTGVTIAGCGSRDSILTDADVSRVLIPVDGTYTFEASAIDGACGFALGEDTILALYDSNGVLLLSNDDIDFASLDLCSRVTTTLTAGSYFVAVFGYNALPYKVEARSGV